MQQADDNAFIYTSERYATALKWVNYLIFQVLQETNHILIMVSTWHYWHLAIGKSSKGNGLF